MSGPGVQSTVCWWCPVHGLIPEEEFMSSSLHPTAGVGRDGPPTTPGEGLPGRKQSLQRDLDVEQGCVTVTVDHYSARDAQRWATLRAGNVVPDGEPFVVFLRPMLDTLGPAALEAVGA